MKNLISIIALIALLAASSAGYSQEKRIGAFFQKKNNPEKLVYPQKIIRNKIKLKLPIKKRAKVIEIPSTWGTPITGNFRGSASYGLKFQKEKVATKVLFINSKDIFQKTPVGIPVVGITATF